MKFEYTFLNSQEEAILRLEIINDYLKSIYKVDFVFNYDIHALSTWFDRNELDFNRFECLPENRNIRFDGQTKVYCIGFEDIVKYYDLSFKHVKGYNQKSAVYFDEKTKSFFTDDLDLVIYHFDEYFEYMKDNVIRLENESKAWNHFEKTVKPKMNSKKLGEKFEVLEPIADHFLNCMPPIYGKGCFYMSEPYGSTAEGKNIYYKFTRAGKKHFIEFNTVN